MEAVEPDEDGGQDGFKHKHPTTCYTLSRPTAPSKHAASPRPQSRQSRSSSEESFATAAYFSPVPPASADVRANERPSSASTEASYNTTNTAAPPPQSDASAELPTVGLTSPTPLPTRLDSERQRWLLSHNTAGGRSDTIFPPSSTSPRETSAGSSSEPSSTSPNRLTRPSRSSHGIDNSHGPPPALLSRRSQPRDLSRRSPTSKTVAQRGLRPLNLVALRESHNRQDSDSPVRPGTARIFSGLKSPGSASSSLISPRTLPATQTMDARPRSSGRNMAQTAQDYFEANGPTSGEDESPAPEARESGTEGQSSEDVFLNLAQANTDQASGGLMRRRVRWRYAP